MAQRTNFVTVALYVPLISDEIRRCTLIWASTRENLSSGVSNNKDADQPAHPRSLISAFIIHFSESTIAKLATSENSIF